MPQRHDEEHEKANDRLRQEVMDTHRFQSFANQRETNDVKWYIDGHDYFWALSEILEQARETIWILDCAGLSQLPSVSRAYKLMCLMCAGWLSPEVYLRRPPAQHEEWRLDRVLKRKAEQGVKVFVIVYKEVNTTMTMNSKYTKHALEELHENISVMRHPDHSGGGAALQLLGSEIIVREEN